jgi:hypothetical protein
MLGSKTHQIGGGILIPRRLRKSNELCRLAAVIVRT